MECLRVAITGPAEEVEVKCDVRDEAPHGETGVEYPEFPFLLPPTNEREKSRENRHCTVCVCQYPTF